MHPTVKITSRWSLRLILMLATLLSGPLFMAACSGLNASQDWHTADRSSSGLAPTPQQAPEAIVQVYAARAFSWRGYFAVHTWIATKAANADTYEVHEVMGWRRDKVRTGPGLPDRAWYGNEPTLLADIRGPAADRLIPAIKDAVARYPYRYEYDAWPGPNSNTFTAWVIRAVPGLDVALPNIAVGKDYLEAPFVAETPSDSGFQVSAFGYAGVLASLREGLEINLLGLSFGLDPLALGIKLPGIGQIGLLDPWQPDSDSLDDGQEIVQPSPQA
ncbi:DUF3750 domain-containing protein [Marinobacter halodurans]|uniref:DUF3750 domain-containing protein n=1 Tax=Marinobacter halodurans TaxID=2528979 RepID=A0ABY1ZET9_9GAMM|nr:DUF3750 domain-containing protein [Marinobacter halodurans]TBW48978.1 DUF3750 domain-containing protein [Marinobacter halodurans]